MSSTNQGEPAPSLASVSVSDFDRYLDRFLRDDGTICLVFLLLVLAFCLSVWKVYSFSRSLWKSLTRNAPEAEAEARDSICALTSSTLSMTISSQLDSTMGSASGSSSGSDNSGSDNSGSNNNNNNTKVVVVEEPETIGLSKMLLLVVGASAIGFLWGKSFSDNVEARALVGAVVSLFGSATAHLPPMPGIDTDETPATNPTDDGLSSPTSSQTDEALLERFLKEREGRTVSLPAFASNNNNSNNNNSGEGSTVQQPHALDRRKHFAEFVVHPVLLVSGTEEHPDEPSETVAIAVRTDAGSIDDETDGIELARDLLREIVTYQDVEQVTVLLVSSGADPNTVGCPPLLSSDDFPLTIDCLSVDPSWGYEHEGRVDELLPDDGFDVSIVLSGCHSGTLRDRLWEKELYDSTDSMVLTCTGPRRPNGKSLTSIGVADQHLRIDRIESLFTNADGNGVENNSYTQIVDYEVRGINMALAFHKNMDDGTYKWHLNEANYNTELTWRLRHGVRDNLRYFDGADMLRVQFPTKQSANSFCMYMDDYDESEDEDEYFCDYGYDPYVTNVPIDKIYVGQSTSGENAGRGVFTSVDILETGTMIGMETNVHPVDYPPMSKAIVDAVVDMKVYNGFGEPLDGSNNDDNEDDDDEDDEDEDAYIGGDSVLMTTALHRAPSTYAEAYGFDDEPWGIPQTSVYSNILTFTNHGCNGTANIGHNVPGLNEFTMDTNHPNFEIPAAFRQFSAGEYSPHRDRAYLGTITTSQVEHPPVLSGQELFDNYMGFGGDTAFVEQVNELRRDCSGALGTVERHQMLLQTKSHHKNKSDPLHKKRRKSKEPPTEDSNGDGEEEAKQETTESAPNEEEDFDSEIDSEEEAKQETTESAPNEEEDFDSEIPKEEEDFDSEIPKEEDFDSEIPKEEEDSNTDDDDEDDEDEDEDDEPSVGSSGGTDEL